MNIPICWCCERPMVRIQYEDTGIPQKRDEATGRPSYTYAEQVWWCYRCEVGAGEVPDPGDAVMAAYVGS